MNHSPSRLRTACFAGVMLLGAVASARADDMWLGSDIGIGQILANVLGALVGPVLALVLLITSTTLIEAEVVLLPVSMTETLVEPALVT